MQFQQLNPTERKANTPEQDNIRATWRALSSGEWVYFDICDVNRQYQSAHLPFVAGVWAWRMTNDGILLSHELVSMR